MPMISVAPVSGFPSNLQRLPPPRSFSEASAQVQTALDELRAAEVALERQLSDLRSYMRTNDLPTAGAPRSSIQ